MKSTLTILFFLLSCSFALAQTSGTAFLAGQSDHSGILVRFTPVSPSGQLDSTTTDPSGQFNLNLQAGVYEIQFSKAGYLSTPYQNGTPVVLGGSTATTLQSITLQNGVFRQISGDVHGTFSPDTIYLFTGEGRVPEGKTLNIQAGTNVQFAGEYSLIVEGNIIAIGQENQEITFSLNSTAISNQWGTIHVRGSDTLPTGDTAIFHHCRFLNAVTALNITQYDINGPTTFFDFHENELRFMEHGGVGLQGSVDATIMNNEFFNVNSTAINVSNSAATTVNVQCNNIHNGAGNGISTFGSDGTVLIASNYIHDMLGNHNHGIQVSPSGGNHTVQNNLVLDCYVGISEGTHTPGVNPVQIRNNVVNGCTRGIQLGAFGLGIAEMNVVRQCSIGIFQPYFVVNGPVSVAYNALWSNTIDFDNVLLPGLGNIAVTNANGDSTDLWFNLFSDPLISAPNTWYPISSSPLVNAGNPNAPLDQDGSTSDIGLRQLWVSCLNIPELGTRLVITNAAAPEPVAEEAITLYPNPTAGRFEITSPDRIEAVEMYNLNGQRMTLQSLGNNAYQAPRISAGIYFLRIQTKNGLASKRLMIQ